MRSYEEQNIYLQLPKNLTTDEIDYLAVWSAEDKTDLGHIVLYENASYELRKSVPEALGYHNKTVSKSQTLSLKIRGQQLEDVFRKYWEISTIVT